MPLGWDRTLSAGIFKSLCCWLPRPSQQRFGNPPQLPGDNAEPDNDQAANGSGGAGANEGVSKAEFIDRDTKSDHHESGKKGKRTDTKQKGRHTPSILS